MLFHGLVIAGDFHLAGVLAIPPETYPIPVIDADAVLSGPVAFERFEPVARGKAQFLEPGRGFELGELAESDFMDAGWKFRWPVAEPKGVGWFIGE